MSGKTSAADGSQDGRARSWQFLSEPWRAGSAPALGLASRRLTGGRRRSARVGAARHGGASSPWRPSAPRPGRLGSASSLGAGFGSRKNDPPGRAAQTPPAEPCGRSPPVVWPGLRVGSTGRTALPWVGRRGRRPGRPRRSSPRLFATGPRCHQHRAVYFTAEVVRFAKIIVLLVTNLEGHAIRVKAEIRVTVWLWPRPGLVT